MTVFSKEVKLLRHTANIQGIVRRQLLPPVMVDVDPVNGTCNLDCAWCCQAASRKSTPTTFMPDATMQHLGKFCEEWGVKAWRIASDSEPLLNKNLQVLIDSGSQYGIDMGLITNGVFLERVLPYARQFKWIGVSLDATTADTWSVLKRSGTGDFYKILHNIRKLKNLYPEIDLSIKFLRWSAGKNLDKSAFGGGLLPIVDAPPQDRIDNTRDAESLADLAKQLGVDYILKDAYPKDFAEKYQFQTCHATPLGGVFGADHRFHLCCDARGVFVLTDDYTQNDWRELPSLWGSPRHWELIDSIVPAKCAGCAKFQTNELIEHLVGTTPSTPDYQPNFI